MTEPTDGDESLALANRYGRPTAGGVRRFGPVVVLAALALLAWAVWAAVAQPDNMVGALVQSYDVRSAHEIQVTVQVTRSATDAVHCTVTAIASDHADVGEAVVGLPTGSSGTRTVTTTIKTERLATTASVDDCR